MNKIGWCDMTWNPVWGCRNHCEYCYARKMAKRFWQQIGIWELEKYREETLRYDKLFNNLHDFKPTFLYSQHYKKLPKKPQRIFVGSMSEIYYWREEWIEMVIKKVKQYPQHIFQFLTKYPSAYQKYEFPDNCWLGVTLTENYKYGKPGRWDFWQFKQDNKNNLKFVSFEPLLIRMNLIYYLNLEDIKWVIIGAETGNRKGKIIPKLDWVLEIVRYCEHSKIPVYIKDNLTKYYAECRGYKEFPKKNYSKGG